MRRSDHYANGFAIKLLAPQGSEDADAEHDRVEVGPSIAKSVWLSAQRRVNVQHPKPSCAILKLNASRLWVLVGEVANCPEIQGHVKARGG